MESVDTDAKEAPDNSSRRGEAGALAIRNVGERLSVDYQGHRRLQQLGGRGHLDIHVALLRHRLRAEGGTGTNAHVG